VASADTRPEALVHHMIGRELTELFPRRRREPGEVLLSVSGLSASDPRHPARTLRDIGFELCAGEVLGIGGLLGSGRSELLLHLFGAWGKRSGGRVALRGAPFAAESPRGAIASGMVLVPESRKRDGLVLPQTIGFNLSLSSLSRHTFAGVLRPAALAEAEQRVFESLGVRAAGCHVPVAEVSGGNQQKVVLGKALLTDPAVVLLDEPTRGIDVGAKAEVCELINQLTDRGVGVLLVSSELEELLAMSDRILILRRGEIAGHFGRGDATPSSLLAASLGEAA
jgi:D-xylose transport system ATP-binding protein